MAKTLALRMAFSEDDLQMAFLTLKKNDMLPKDCDIDYFTEGEAVEVNMDEIDKDQSLDMCTGLMAALVYGKQKQKEAV